MTRSRSCLYGVLVLLYCCYADVDETDGIRSSCPRGGRWSTALIVKHAGKDWLIRSFLAVVGPIIMVIGLVFCEGADATTLNNGYYSHLLDGDPLCGYHTEIVGVVYLD